MNKKLSSLSKVPACPIWSDFFKAGSFRSRREWNTIVPRFGDPLLVSEAGELEEEEASGADQLFGREQVKSADAAQATLRRSTNDSGRFLHPCSRAYVCTYGHPHMLCTITACVICFYICTWPRMYQNIANDGRQWPVERSKMIGLHGHILVHTFCELLRGSTAYERASIHTRMPLPNCPQGAREHKQLPVSTHRTRPTTLCYIALKH